MYTAFETNKPIPTLCPFCGKKSLKYDGLSFFNSYTVWECSLCGGYFFSPFKLTLKDYKKYKKG